MAWTLGLEKLLGDRPFFEASPEPDDAEEPDNAAPLDARAMRDARRLRMSHWQHQFDDINNALLGVELSGTIREVIEKYETGTPGDTAP